MLRYALRLLIAISCSVSVSNAMADWSSEMGFPFYYFEGGKPRIVPYLDFGTERVLPIDGEGFGVLGSPGAGVIVPPELQFDVAHAAYMRPPVPPGKYIMSFYWQLRPKAGFAFAPSNYLYASTCIWEFCGIRIRSLQIGPVDTPSTHWNFASMQLVAYEGVESWIVFGSGSGPGGYAELLIDKVTVSPAPEPEMMAMLLAGLGFVGANSWFRTRGNANSR